jgi:peptidoglycan-N-acetylglucosamine deacetylase
MFYFVKMYGWIQALFPKYLWQMTSAEKKLYLTFDDGPHPIYTAFVLDELKKHHAKATFFCIGNNVQLYPDVYKRIIDEGHSVGNHTYNHLNGSKTKTATYIQDINEAAKYIDSNLFRPPYGRISTFKAKLLLQKNNPYKIVMWTVLSGDFDLKLSKQRCLKNVLSNVDNGSIVVFHDSEKASERLMFTLPIVLEKLQHKGFTFEKITV